MAHPGERIASLIERLGRLVAGDGHGQGLVPVQWEALRFLARANRFSRSPGCLTAYLGSTKGTVSQTLKALERKGLILKVAKPEDRRAVDLELTEAGRLLLRQDPLGDIRSIIEGLPKELGETLERGLEEILQGRLKAKDRRPFGLCGSCRFFRKEDPEGDPHFCGLLKLPLKAEDADQICLEQEPLASYDR